MMVTETQLLDAQSTYDKKKKEKSLVCKQSFEKILLTESTYLSVKKAESVFENSTVS